MQRLLQKLYPERTFTPDMPDAVPDGSNIVLAPRAIGLLQDLGQDGWTGVEETLRLNIQDLVS